MFNNTEEIKFYFSRDLRGYLKSQNLPHNRSTLVHYEKQGIIPAPNKRIRMGNVEWRIYTWDEIVEIANVLREKKIIKNE